MSVKATMQSVKFLTFYLPLSAERGSTELAVQPGDLLHYEPDVDLVAGDLAVIHLNGAITVSRLPADERQLSSSERSCIYGKLVLLERYIR